MPALDLLLLHAPSVYDFRERPTVYGPISDVIPSTPVFEMYPLGFVSILGYLTLRGYMVRIVNLAVKMLKKPNFDVEKFISKQDPQAFGLDLHWLAHAAGSLEVAEIIKKHHPEKPVILGGFSASYFHREIIQNYPQVDYVLRGDTTETPLMELLKSVNQGDAPENISNLTWRDSDGRKRINQLSYVPETLEGLGLDYGDMVEHVVKNRDMISALPFADFLDYPFTAVLTCKGCNYNCITCGGSNSAFKKYFGRARTVFKSPQSLVEEMRIISDYFKAPLFLIGDLRQAGAKWAEEVLKGIREEDFDNTITYELFDSVPANYMKNLARSADSWTLEISPESHDDSVREIMGKPYTVKQMEKTLKSALDAGTKKLDVYFMVGLSGQTADSVMDSVEYSRRLYDKLGGTDKLHTFISPMAPFLDPGSVVFENPEQYGFKKHYSSLREHKEALSMPSWKHYLSYDTLWMTRDEIVDVTYDSMIGMSMLKSEIGVITPLQMEKTVYGLKMAQKIMKRIDEIIRTSKAESERWKQYADLQSEIEEAQKTMGYSKRELRMPGLAGIRVSGVLKYLLGKIGFRK
jgi:B12-binding domain/radical SAM domain protein